MMKRLYIIGMVLASMTLVSIPARSYDFEVNGICYDILDLAVPTCGVSGIIEDSANTDDLVIPSHVSYLGKDLTVTEILGGGI